jgi:hypothetical protein
MRQGYKATLDSFSHSATDRLKIRRELNILKTQGLMKKNMI